MTTEDLNKDLARLGFYYLSERGADFCAHIAKRKLSGHELLTYIARSESDERMKRGTLRRVGAARIGRFRPMSEFDWNWPKKIDRDLVEELMKLNFIEEPANVVMFGPSGIGKTMIAKNIAYQAALAGHRTLFMDASDLISDLEKQESPRLLKLRISRYSSPQVLVIDEVGYLSYSNRAADLIFQVISRRHEHSSTIITTNITFKEWGSVFPSAGCMVALIDRLTHRAEIVSIEGDSYRRKEASERKNKRQPKEKK
jgi:DNA replication protein DnaC